MISTPPLPFMTARHTHYVTIALPGYTDSFLCTPPADLEGKALQDWAEAEVIRRRDDHGWTVTVTRAGRGS